MKSYEVTEWGKPLQARVRETPVPKGREVLLRLTHGKGVARVANLAGGRLRWRAQRFPVDGGTD